MFSRMGGKRLETTSSAEVPMEAIMSGGVRGSPDVAGLSSLEGRKLCVLLWHYHDDDVAGPEARVHLLLSHLPIASGSAHSCTTASTTRTATPSRFGSRWAARRLRATSSMRSSRRRDGWRRLPAPETVAVQGGQATLDIALPRRAVSLLTLEFQ